MVSSSSVAVLNALPFVFVFIVIMYATLLLLTATNTGLGIFPTLKPSENAGQNGKFVVPVAVLDRLNSNVEDV
jgi:hypothetical protein